MADEPRSNSPDETFDLDWNGEDSPDCYWCAGEGWEECDDPIQCTDEHDVLGQHRCSSCGGSGLAKDMTIW